MTKKYAVVICTCSRLFGARLFGAGLFAVGLFGSPAAHASCGSTVCTINTNWDEHGRSHPGWSADLRYNYSRADTLRSGSKKIDADTSADEVENLSTTNEIIAASLDYTVGDNWGVMLHLPFIKREHAHNLGPYSGGTAAGYESFHASAWGDAKIVGRYRWSLAEAEHAEVGVKFGLKLDTGKKDFVFTETGILPGEASLQPGNGSTDLILGVFWHQAPMASDWSWFAQGTLQNSIRSRATFRPGKQINMDGGTRYALTSKLNALLQLNAQWNDADTGSAASYTSTGAASSGGHSLALAPGVSYAISSATQLYALLQLPLYQYVNGEQLTSKSSLSVGLNYRF